jgi:hypothetical protein
MVERETNKQRYTCGQHVSGHGRQIATRNGEPVPKQSGKELVIEKGVIVMLPSKRNDPYTVLDEQTFIVLEAQGDHLTPLP